MRLASVVAVLALLWAGAAAAQHVPQTILVDGVNDFNVANQVEDDSNDTQGGFCSPPGQPMDIGAVYMTNDSNNLYIGFTYNKRCFGSNNLGIAIDVGSVGGGTTDPWSRKIAWNNVPFKPDFVAYAVCDNNWQDLRQWNGSSWVSLSAGTNALGWSQNSGFEEVAFPLTTLGVTPGTVLHVEWWMTQEGVNKGPLDAVRSDDVQLSTPSGTTWEVPTPVEMSSMYSYTVLNVIDTTPPVVNLAVVADWDANDDGHLEVTSTKVDVTFNEPVDSVTGQVPTNYVVTRGGSPYTVSSAVRDPGNLALVHLTLSAAIGAHSTFYKVLVQNVKDQANNTIVNNGTTNVREFFIRQVRYEGDMTYYLRSHGAAPDTFTVEGGAFPITWSLCDNAFLADGDVDSVYTGEIAFSVPKNPVTGEAIQTVDWKFVHDCDTYETIGNRLYTINATEGALDTIQVYWDNNAPENFTTHPIDVVYQVDANSRNPGVSDEVAVAGNQSPLSFTLPSSFVLVDDGSGQDQVPGDGIYTIVVRFPTNTFKNVEYKYTYNDEFECSMQGNRSIYLNDALYDTLNGTNGPLLFPVDVLDRCTVTRQAVKVIFSVDMAGYISAKVPQVALNGSVLPLNFDYPPLPTSIMKDDGVAPDQTAGDLIYTLAVTFPDSSAYNVEYKYMLDGTYECNGKANRSLGLDDVNHSVSNPMILDLADYNKCGDLVGVPEGRVAPPSLVVEQNVPNPFNPLTTIRFAVEKTQRVSLRVFGPGGRLVSTLVDRDLEAGTYTVRWDGRDAAGKAVPSGVYFYEVSAAGEREARRMVLLK
jgi:hypothetical protein